MIFDDNLEIVLLFSFIKTYVRGAYYIRLGDAFLMSTNNIFFMIEELTKIIFKSLSNYIKCGASLGRGSEILFAACGSHDQDGRHAHIW